MGLLDLNMQYAAIGTAILLLLGFLFYQPNDFVRWLQKKNYQYEVTSALYMLTPTEKFVFNSVLFLTLSMFTIACCVYLPNHVAIMSTRAYYYFAGDAPLFGVSRSAASHISGKASKASEAVVDAATSLAGAAYRAAFNTGTVRPDAVSHAAAAAAGSHWVSD